MMENILISACLLGVDCRYDGGNSYFQLVEELKKNYNLIPICPEIMGGLTTPRDPSEILGDRVISSKGQDLTENFKKGAKEALKLCKFYNCKKAILKERSPSCGFGLIYDGSFQSKKIEGKGFTSRLLEDFGIEIIGESKIEEVLL